jgi:hypothetical protein
MQVAAVAVEIVALRQRAVELLLLAAVVQAAAFQP